MIKPIFISISEYRPNVFNSFNYCDVSRNQWGVFLSICYVNSSVVRSGHFVDDAREMYQ